MLNQQDVDYLLQREAEERQRAASALDLSVQSVHLELAERYADAAWAAEEDLDCPVRASGLWQRHAGIEQQGQRAGSELTDRQPSMRSHPMPVGGHAYLERRCQECLAGPESATDPAIARVYRN